jgi:hypothetical protein
MSELSEMPGMRNAGKDGRSFVVWGLDTTLPEAGQ